MAITASNIVSKALTLVDEEVVEFAQAASTETSLKDISLGILPEVCRNLIKVLPYELKRYLSKTYAAIPIETLDNGELQTDYYKQKVAVVMPSDFWELVAIKMKVWARPVTKYILIDSPLYSKQNNPFTRAGKQNPVVALSNSASTSGGRVELFSINDGDSNDITVFEYISFDNIPDDSSIEWPDELMDEVSKALASQLNLIKGRLQEGVMRDEESDNAIATHE